MPITGLILALLKTNAYTGRYVIDGAIGIGILLAAATWNGIRGRASGGICILVLMLGVGAMYQRHLFSYTTPQGAETAAEIAGVVAGQPIRPAGRDGFTAGAPSKRCTIRGTGDQ